MDIKISDYPKLQLLKDYHTRFKVGAPRSLSLKVSLGEISQEHMNELLRNAIETNTPLPIDESSGGGIID